MKKCPTCEKTYDDNLKFCQTDGTPLVEVKESAPPPDPYATMVASKDEIMSAMPTGDAPKDSPSSSAAEEDDLLDIPDEGDMMKTAVVTEAERKSMFGDEESSKPIPPPTGQSNFQDEPKRSDADTLLAQPEPPKFNEPSLNPPSFGDLSSSSSSESSSEKPASPFGNEPPSFDRQPLPSDFDQPKPDENQFNAPIPSPFGEQMPPSYNQPSSSPFEPPEFKVEEAKAEALNTPFAEEVSYGNQQMAEQSWTPPAVPEQNWQNQEIGQNTPFQPPPAGAQGENKTLAIVSLVLGILSIPCCGFVVFGLAAVVTGFMARSKASNNPNEYGGSGMAMAGIIIGAIMTLIGIVTNLLYLLGMITLPR